MTGHFDKENVEPAVGINSLQPKGTSPAHSHNKTLPLKSPPKLCPPISNAILKLAQQPPTSFLTPQSEGNSSCTPLPSHNPPESILTAQPEQLKLATPESPPQPTRLPRTTISPLLEASPTALDETADLLQEALSSKERNPGISGPGNVEEVVVPHLDSIHQPIPNLVSWKSLQVLHSPEKPWSPTLPQTETVKQPGQGGHRALDAESEIFEAPGDLYDKCNSTYEDSLTLEEEHPLKESLEACMPSLSPVLRSLPSLHSATPNVDKLLQRKVHSRRPHDRQLLVHSIVAEPKCDLREQPPLPGPSRCTRSGLDCGAQQKQQTGNKIKRVAFTFSKQQEVTIVPGLVTHRKAGLKGDHYSITPGKNFSIENMDDSSKLGNECIPNVRVYQRGPQTTSVNVTEGITFQECVIEDGTITSQDCVTEGVTEDSTITSQECVGTLMKAKPVKRRRKRGRPPKKQPSSPTVRQNNASSTSTDCQPDMTVDNARLSCEPSVSDSAGFKAVQTKENSSKASIPRVSRKRRRKAEAEQYLPMRVTRRTAALQKATLEEGLAADLPVAKRWRPSSTLTENPGSPDVPWEEKSGGTVETAVMQDEECTERPSERLSPTTMNANSSAEAIADATVPSENSTGAQLRNAVQVVPHEREHSTVTKVRMSLSPHTLWK